MVLWRCCACISVEIGPDIKFDTKRQPESRPPGGGEKYHRCVTAAVYCSSSVHHVHSCTPGIKPTASGLGLLKKTRNLAHVYFYYICLLRVIFGCGDALFFYCFYFLNGEQIVERKRDELRPLC